MRNVDTARAFLAVLGLAFAVGGVLVASVCDRLAGIACLVIGAFLLILPLMSYRSDD